MIYTYEDKHPIVSALKKKGWVLFDVYGNRVCKGEMPHVDGTYSDKQWEKIQWANENKKTVEIIVLEKNDAFNLFVQAINAKFVLDDVEIRNKQYKIINN